MPIGFTSHIQNAMPSPRHINASTFTGLLLAISLFCAICLSYTQWQSTQNQRIMMHYQAQQAWQIAANQRVLNKCERSVTQNSLQFMIDCSSSHIRVVFPLGEITLEKP